MNVQQILNQSLDPQRLKNNLIQSQDSPTKYREKPKFDKRATQQLQNNFMANNQNNGQPSAFILANRAGDNQKQQILRKKQFQFQHQQNQFENFMNQTQHLG